jgi:hypothetical protein
MPSNEGHIHWPGGPSDEVTYLNQSLTIAAVVSNMATIVNADPIGTLRIKLTGSSLTGLALPTDGWQAIPDTSPVLEARVDGYYPEGYIRIRQA